VQSAGLQTPLYMHLLYNQLCCTISSVCWH